jgi:large subunit ribosomal protein L7Ae
MRELMFLRRIKMEQVYEAIEVAKKTGSIRKGINEATKAVERSKAKLVAYANDVSPKEIIMHLPIICKDKNILCFEVGSKEELGAAAGIARGCAAVAVTKEGEAKKLIEALKPKGE